MTQPPETTAARATTSERLRRHGAKLAVSLVLAAAFGWTLHRGGLRIVPPRDALARVSLPACAGYVALMLAMQWFRAARWRHLLAPIATVPLRRIVAVSFIGFTAILLLPLRAGELVRPYLIRDKGKLSLAAATGTIGAERVIDGLFLTLLLGVCLQIARPLSPLPDHIGKLPISVAAVPLYAYTALAAFVVAFVLMGLFYWRPALGHRLAAATLGPFSTSLAARAEDFVKKIADGLHFLPSPRHFGPFLFETALYWGLNAVGMWVLAHGCGIASMTLVQACVVMGVLGVGILVPAGPGLFGAFQWSIFAALAMYFPDDVVLGPGEAFVFLVYAIQFVWHLASAGYCLATERGAAHAVVEAELG